jgi:putative DNA primase/helicase
VLCIVEGFATGATVHEATGHAVAVAFDAGNLLPVANSLRRKFPNTIFIVCADDDYRTQGNPGITKAKLAAETVGALLAVPKFPGDRPENATDFNDMASYSGLESVKQLIADLVQPALRASTTSLLTIDTGFINDDRWPDPTPLPNALPAVHAFDAELLPHALRAWVMDVAHRMQCPPDFPAVGAIVAISSLIGARAVVQPKCRDDWRVVPNLWGMVIGRPGVMKSPSLSEVLKPLNRLQSEANKEAKDRHKEWEVDCRLTELQNAECAKDAKRLANKDPIAARAKLESVEPPEEPAPRRFVVNDATVEKLGDILSLNPWGVLCYRDELYGLLTSMDKPGQEGARSFYLQAYDGDKSFTTDRIGRGTVHIERVCLAMIGGIQPGRIMEYVRNAVGGGSSDDGLLQRFGLTVWPDVSANVVHIDQWPDKEARDRATSVFERLASFNENDVIDPDVWRFNEQAQEAFNEWRMEFERELKSDVFHPAMESHLAKYRKLVPALALIFALIDTPDSGCLIHERELLRALAWSDYLRTHAERLYSAVMTPEMAAAITLLGKIRGKKLTDTAGQLMTRFTPRQIALKNWTSLQTPDQVRKAAEILIEHDWLRREVVTPTERGGRPSDQFVINPVAYEPVEQS